MFNRTDSCANRFLNSIGSMSMSGYGPAKFCRLLYQRLDFIFIEKSYTRLPMFHQDRARHADFDPIGAVFHLFAHRFADLVDAVCDAVQTLIVIRAFLGDRNKTPCQA